MFLLLLCLTTIHFLRDTNLDLVDIQRDLIANPDVQLLILAQAKPYHGRKAAHHLLRDYATKVLEHIIHRTEGL